LSWLHGYPSQISFFAHLIRECGFEDHLKIEIITLGAENLNSHQLKIISNVFNCRIVQHYGLSEGCANISERPGGEMIPDMDFCLVEFDPIDEKDPSLCRIIGTNYNNFAFPLIRYDTGDTAVVEKKSDGSIRILSIDGRKEDYIFLKNGIQLGRLDHIFKDLIHVKEAQIVQEENYDLDIFIVKGAEYDILNTEQKLIKEIKKRISDELNYKITYVEKINRTTSGKLRLVVSKVKS